MDVDTNNGNCLFGVLLGNSRTGKFPDQKYPRILDRRQFHAHDSVDALKTFHAGEHFLAYRTLVDFKHVRFLGDLMTFLSGIRYKYCGSHP